MADFELIQDRYISGQGLLRIPTDVRKNRLLILYCDVIRPPKNIYLNLNYLPPRSQYGWLTFFRNGYLTDTKDIRFPKESFDGINDISGQSLIALKCAYDGILESFANLGTALGLTVVSVVDTIQDYENLNLSWDEVRVRCYADTALQLRLYRLKYDSCAPDKDKDKQPPPPPPPRDPVPPGTPITDLDPPYTGGEPDDTTQPYDGDDFPVEPPGEQCSKYHVVVRVFSNFSPPPDYRDIEIFVYGEVGEPFIEVSGGARSAVISAYGRYAPTDEGCLSSPALITLAAGLNSFDPPPVIILFEEG
jgi:hypothetical protein